MPPTTYDYKAFPLNQLNPVTKQQIAWRPALRVVIFHGHKKSAPIESILDTGADHTIFHGQIAQAIGITLENGIRHEFAGVAVGMKAVGYFHRVKLLIAGHTIETTADFSNDIAAGGILGQVGFFDHFVVTFDWTPNPPRFEVQRIARN
jgi:hypothetical protein